MTGEETKSPAQLRAERFETLRSRWAGLSGRTTLAYLNDEIEDTAGKVEALPHRIAELRKRGHCYSSSWEARAQTLAGSWPERRRDAIRILREQARSLEGLGKEIQELCDHSMLSDSALDRLENRLQQLESQIGGAERSVRGTFDTLGAQMGELERELGAVEFMLDSLDTASFDIYPDEHGVAVCKATWTNHPDEPEGLLFLTAGRLIFEQREKKAKKKVLFITTESELLQEKLWESPIGNVGDLEAEDKKKFLSRKELLHLGFREYTSGLHGDVSLQLHDTSNEEWVGLIKRVQTGEIEADRHGAPAAAEAPVDAGPPAPTKEIPTKCPACGGKLPPVVKGMRELVCEYCNTSVRL